MTSARPHPWDLTDLCTCWWRHQGEEEGGGKLKMKEDERLPRPRHLELKEGVRGAEGAFCPVFLRKPRSREVSGLARAPGTIGAKIHVLPPQSSRVPLEDVRMTVCGNHSERSECELLKCIKIIVRKVNEGLSLGRSLKRAGVIQTRLYIRRTPIPGDYICSSCFLQKVC